MLPKENRLKKKKDFDRVFRFGKAFFTPVLGVKAARNELQITRFGIVISKAISKRAVKRNLVRRRLREILRREILPRLAPGYDIVFLTRPGILDKTFDDLKKNVIFILSKMRLM